MNTELITAVVTVLGGVSTVGVIILRTLKQARSVLDGIDDAVNRRHEKHPQGHQAPKLYDLLHMTSKQAEAQLAVMQLMQDDLKEIRAWRESYRDSPWNTGAGVTKWLDEHEKKYNEILEKVRDCQCPHYKDDNTTGS